MYSIQIPSADIIKRAHIIFQMESQLNYKFRRNNCKFYIIEDIILAKTLDIDAVLGKIVVRGWEVAE